MTLRWGREGDKDDTTMGGERGIRVTLRWGREGDKGDTTMGEGGG